jgi:hypothetical protein
VVQEVKDEDTSSDDEGWMVAMNKASEKKRSNVAKK